jgi:hypothetical protein
MEEYLDAFDSFDLSYIYLRELQIRNRPKVFVLINWIDLIYIEYCIVLKSCWQYTALLVWCCVLTN